MKKIEVKRTINAPIEAVFAVITDHEGYASFPGVNSSRLTREGQPDRNGMGATRELKMNNGLMLIVENIVGFDAPTLMEYRITKMRPKLFNHVIGRVSLAERDGKTHVTWTSEFDVPLPIVGSKIENTLAKPFSQAFAGMLKTIDKRLS